MKLKKILFKVYRKPFENVQESAQVTIHVPLNILSSWGNMLVAAWFC